MPAKDLEKRRKVMQRSIKLGHCICDPKRGCPCDALKNFDLCPCAGERPEPKPMEGIKLTQMVHNAGCASKIPAVDLERFLAGLPEVNDPDVISGLASGDDAGIYRIADGVHLVQTVDVFTPVVDDPYEFGKVCAANCLSDIYAMGGVPKTALSILAFPSESQDGRIMHLMMKGAMEVLNAAGCALLGGHSIKDEEIKLGFAITGLIDPAKAAELENAQVNDILVLTKPLGVGVLNFARQIGRGDPVGIAQAEGSMAILNKDASEAMNEVGVSACTDVTGFGLFGHLMRMARHSGVSVRVYADAIPAFPGAIEAFRQGIIPGAVERNREFLAGDIEIEAGVDESYVHLGCDAQTSGGLLIAVQPPKHQALLDALKKRGVAAYTIGAMHAKSAGKIELVRSEGSIPGPDHIVKAAIAAQPVSPHASAVGDEEEYGDHNDPTCCADVFASVAGAPAPVAATQPTTAPTAPGETTAGASMRAFGQLMLSSSSDGKIDARTKELINFAMVLVTRCEPCLNIHYDKARKMGISQEELDEVAWCAIAMGGAPVKMFYGSFLERVAGKG